jgi:hypothetical protein
MVALSTYYYKTTTVPLIDCEGYLKEQIDLMQVLSGEFTGVSRQTVEGYQKPGFFGPTWFLSVLEGVSEPGFLDQPGFYRY